MNEMRNGIRINDVDLLEARNRMESIIEVEMEDEINYDVRKKIAQKINIRKKKYWFKKNS